MRPLLAASTSTVSPWPGVLILLCLALILITGYALACFIWPYRACPRCTGSGKRRSPSGRAWRLCRRCRGSGARLRIGRRLWNLLHARRKAAE